MINICLDQLASGQLNTTQTKLLFDALTKLFKQSKQHGPLLVQIHHGHHESKITTLEQTLSQYGWDASKRKIYVWAPIVAYPLEHPCNQNLRLHAAAWRGADVDLYVHHWPTSPPDISAPIAQFLILSNTAWKQKWPLRMKLKAKTLQLTLALKGYEAVMDLGSSELGSYLREKIKANWINLDNIEEAIKASKAKQVGSDRKKLAWVTPMPPAKTGIATYADALVEQLQQFYDVTIVSDQSNTTSIRKSSNWLLKHGQTFDRIIYHIGNSPFHRSIANCAEHWPGINVMHELYIADLQNNRGRDLLYRELYQQHGYQPVLQASSSHESLLKTLEKFPVSERLINHSLGSIVHSADAKEQIEKLATSPICESVPMVCKSRHLKNKTAARGFLGIDEDVILICSFGLIGEGKGSIDILKSWSRMNPSLRRQSQLVFVGKNNEGAYGQQMIEAVQTLDSTQQVSITGWTDDETYEAYLASCDLAVQLRRINRGETSAAVTDVICSGVPIIVNRKGSFKEIAGEGIVGIPSDYTTEELTRNLEDTLNNLANQSLSLDQRRLERQRIHAPGNVASQYHRAIESIYSQPRAIEQQAIQRIATHSNKIGRDDQQICESILETFKRAQNSKRNQKKLLVDVTQISKKDLRTGIQRVVRSIVVEWIKMDLDWRVEPIYLSTTTGEWRYRYARQWTFQLITETAMDYDDEVVDMKAGDHLVMLDLNGGDLVESSKSGLYERLRQQGVSITGIVYDILPIQRPDCFPDGAAIGHQQWLETMAKNSDQMVCISKAVADETRLYLKEAKPEINTPPIHWFHLGANLSQSCASHGWQRNLPKLEQVLKNGHSFLMVGTIEPRKGHRQTVQAVEQLLDQGEDVNLIVVGKQGWMVDATIDVLEKSRYANRRIFWLNNASDEDLNHLYEACDCLIAASEAEGFGLPLIEAAMKGMPVVARDIPVFREVAQQGAFFFNGSTTESMARDLHEWIQLFRNQAHPKPDKMSWMSWSESAEQLLNHLLTAPQR